MPVELIPSPGSGSAVPVFRAKMNEIIAAINAMQALLTGGAVTQMTWCRVDFVEQEIVGQGANIDSVEFDGSITRIHFIEPFASADDYCAQLTAVTATSAANIDEVLKQYPGYVELFFSSDGGGQILPASGYANVTITYNATL